MRLTRRWPSIDRLSALLLAGIILLGAGLRLRRLMEVPSLTDETDEVLRGLTIAQGRVLPLVNDDAYIGALFNYLVAGLFRLVEPSPMLPRLLVCATGLLTILVTERLGRMVGGRWVGLLAAALLATNALHIVISSRVAWSHSITPLLTTTLLLTLGLALQRASGWLLVLTGLVTGLALQTHPSVVAILPPLAAVFLLAPQGRRWLRTPWPLLAGLATVAGCANLLWYNLVSRPGQALVEAEAYDYAFERKGSLLDYLSTLGPYLIDLQRALSSIFGERSRAIFYLTHPLLILTVVLLVGGLALALKRRQWLLPLLMLLTSLILPYFGRQFSFLPSDLGRYLVPLVPPGLILMALAIVALADWLGARLARPGGLLARGGQALTGLGALLLVGQSMLATLHFEESFPRRAETRFMLEIVAAAEAARHGPVYIDERLNRELLFGGGHLQHGLIYLCELKAVDYRTLTQRAVREGQGARQVLTPGSVVILHESTVDRLTGLLFTLEPLMMVDGENRGARSSYGLYRVT